MDSFIIPKCSILISLFTPNFKLKNGSPEGQRSTISTSGNHNFRINFQYLCKLRLKWCVAYLYNFTLSKALEENSCDE